jgi:uncharacterized protein (DUF1499 family)
MKAKNRLVGLLSLFALAACSADTAGVDFATLVRPASPNTYLVCPKERCAAAADEEGPIYAVPAAQLFERARTLLSAEPRTELVQDQADAMRLVLVQRSAFFRFPDTITLQVFPLPDGSSTLAVYSRSNYGYGDFGVNKDRVRSWIGRIDAQVPRRLGTLILRPLTLS